MKKNLTEMVFILDRSGSMQSLSSDTIGGFNSMIESQKKEDGEAYVTTVLFDDNYELLHDHVDIQKIEPITNKEYYARGCTALLDAVGKTINSIGSRLSATPEEERPEKVIFVITTDGYENSSREFTRHTVKDMIEHQQTKYSWTFMFLGANMDAVSEASSLGISSAYSKTYTASAQGTSSAYYATCDALTSIRSMDAAVYCDAEAKGIATATCLDYIDKASSNTEAIAKVDTCVTKLEDEVCSLSGSYDCATLKSTCDVLLDSCDAISASTLSIADNYCKSDPLEARVISLDEINSVFA